MKASEKIHTQRNFLGIVLIVVLIDLHLDNRLSKFALKLTDFRCITFYRPIIFSPKFYSLLFFSHLHFCECHVKLLGVLAM